jgi:hypothetical protein
VTAIGKHPYSWWGLWVLASTAALTGFWLVQFAIAQVNRYGDSSSWSLAIVASAAFVAGLAGWARLISADQRKALALAAWALGSNLFVFICSYVTFQIVLGTFMRPCNPGQENGPSSVLWLIPALVYYPVGFAALTRLRWIRVVWPLAVLACVIALFVVKLIWTTGSGCGD